MKIKINNNIFYSPINNRVKIYFVPTEYSKDNIYIADWEPEFSIEPYPASDQSKTKFLAYLKNGGNGWEFVEKSEDANIELEETNA